MAAAVVSIIVKFRFEGIHFWPDAAGKVEYLKHPHRHEFHVTCSKIVTHDDRQVEIITFKNEVAYYCRMHFAGPHPNSCESMARQLCTVFGLQSCTVLEDGENGAMCVVQSEK